ncbi:MAG: 4-alpha-glucanotransferase [Actinomycetota bacterium]|nr:4-alpha-glucanotransferase [Actinomycetota bacterium]
MHDWGISMGYHDVAGHWREVPPETLTAIRRAMGVSEVPAAGAGDDPDGGPAPPGTSAHDDPVVAFRPGRAPAEVTAGGPWELHTEDGATIPLGSGSVDSGSLGSGAVLPPDLPLGYHRLRRVGDGWERLLIVSPGRCHLPPDLRTWGWAAQLYATRSRESWGMGDLADLRRLAQWSQRLGAGMCLLNPLHATVPDFPQASPYYPSSRCFRNPLYLRIEELPGAGDAAGMGSFDLDALAAEGRALNADRRIDRDRVWKLKSTALEHLWRRFSAAGGDPAFDAFRAEQGEALAGFATHCALSERFPGAWADWPEEYRRPDSPAVARFASDHADRVGFHCWLQWLTESQLAAAGAGLDLMQDLAVGVDPGGADAWLWQDTMALGMRVGAPPDEFNTRGQDWSLPPFDPWRLRLARYDPWIRTVRAGLRAAGGIRVDHVMGLFRLWWIPVGASPADGAYVRYRYEEMLDILALESHRAGAYVVGEDLGTVEDFVRHELHDRGVLSYRLLWFEPQRPPEFPRQALAAVTTHDLPTIAGMWTGADLAEGHALGLEPNEEGARAIREKLADWSGSPDDADPAEVVVNTHRLLAQAPSMILTATLDDAAVVEERPNVPGTVDERPNWSMALPVPLEELEESPVAGAIADALRRD